MSPIVVGSIHNFSRADDDIFKWKNAKPSPKGENQEKLYMFASFGRKSGCMPPGGVGHNLGNVQHQRKRYKNPKYNLHIENMSICAKPR